MKKISSQFSKGKIILLVLTIAFLGVFFTIRVFKNNEIKTIKSTITQSDIDALNETIDDLNAVLRQKNATISSQSETISSQAETIAEKNATISSQSETISEQASAIETKDATIASQTAAIAEKDATISSQSATISSQASAIETKDATIASQTAAIAEKDATISSQSATISSQASAIETKDATIASQTAAIAEKDATISSQNSTISTQSSRISTLENELSAEMNYQFTIDINFYVDSELYAYGKARSGGTILVAPANPTKANYIFYGWSLTQNGTVIDLSSTTITQATNFYAIFSDNILTLENTINTAYSINTLNSMQEEIAFLQSLYSAISLDNTQKTLTELRTELGTIFEIDNPTSYNFENFLNQILVYINGYKISFIVDSSQYDSTIAYNATGLLKRVPTSPSKSGYIFTGWSLTQNGTVISNLANYVFNSNTYLYAIFEEDVGNNGISDLTGSSWLFNNNVSNINNSYEIDFLVNNGDINYAYIGSNSSSGSRAVSYNLFYGTDGVYNSSSGWSAEYFKTIVITGGIDATNYDLISWITSNATQIPLVEDEDSPDILSDLSGN